MTLDEVSAVWEDEVIHIGQTTIQHSWILICRYDILCRIRIVQIQPKKHILDHADFTTSIRQHELDHTDQESICPEVSASFSGEGWSIRCVNGVNILTKV